MKKHPFVEKSFVLQLAASNRVVTVLRTDAGQDCARILRVEDDAVFIIKSRTAHRIACFLLSDPKGREKLAYGTGYRFANILTLDDFVPVQTNDASRVHVNPDPESRLRALEELDRYGLSLQALFHSHPGTTEHSVNPSSTDLETQQNLEARYGSIGAICNAGGYLQFFTTSMRFQLVVVGKGVEDHGFRETSTGFYHLFRLCHLHADPLPASGPGWLGRIADRSAKALSLAGRSKAGQSVDDLIRTGHWVPRS